MTATPFDPKYRLILVPAWVTGTAGTQQFRLALDTGASVTQVSHHVLLAAGYDLSALPLRHRISTAGGPATAGSLVVDRLLCLGHTRYRFPVMVHTIPNRSGLDGLLGLDFLRGRYLGLDFAGGRIRFGAKSWWRFWL